MLKYLDDRPVFDEERRRTDVWAAVLDSGGSADEALEAERCELALIRKEKDDADERNFKAFEVLMQEGQALRRTREQALQAEDFASVTENPPELNPFSGERILHVTESDELKTIREARWPQEKEEHALVVKPTSKFLSLLSEASAEVASVKDLSVVNRSSEVDLEDLD
eukprot:gene21590-27628_t